MIDILYLKFEDIARPIAFIGCRDLIDDFPLIFSGWRITEIDEEAGSPIVTLDYQDSIYTLTTEWLSEPLKFKDRVDAICGLIAKLVRAYVDDNDQSLLCLHAAAAEFCGTLVVFPSVFRAGKSVLTACLASHNIGIYGDDVLPVSLDSGYCLAAGLPPRLRLPLPENLTAETRQFIEDRTALQGRKYLYLDLRNQALAARGSALPMSAVVLLQRETDIKAVLEPVAKAEILRQVVWQNFAREVEAPQILARLEQMVDGVPLYRLRYDRPEDAVLVLKNEFEQGVTPRTTSRPAPILSKQQDQSVAQHVPAGSYLRALGISEMLVDGEVFLADASGTAIHHLNPVGAAIWNLLANPIKIDEIVELLLVAFSESKKSQVEKDVRRLIKSLQAKRLIITGTD